MTHSKSASMFTVKMLASRAASSSHLQPRDCPDDTRLRCFSAGRSRAPPARVPLAALHWSPGGRRPEELRAGRASVGRSLVGSGVTDFKTKCCKELQVRRAPRSCQRRAHPGPSYHDLRSLAISGVRPASASSTGAITRDALPYEGQRKRPSTAHLCSSVPSNPDAMQPLLQGQRDLQYAPSGEIEEKAQRSTKRILLEDPTFIQNWKELGPGGECSDDRPVLELRSSSGEILGQVVLWTEAQKQALQSLLNEGVHEMRSTMEFWDGTVAGSAEGIVRVHQMSTTTYQMSHNFIELNGVDARTTLAFEDEPEMRITIEGPEFGAVIRMQPSQPSLQ